MTLPIKKYIMRYVHPTVKYRQSGVLTRDSLSRQILKVGDLSRVKAEVKLMDRVQVTQS